MSVCVCACVHCRHRLFVLVRVRRQSCDGVLLLENDHLQDICEQMLRIKQVTVNDLNKVLQGVV